MDINISADGYKIRVSISEVLLCSSDGNLARSKNPRDWTLRNAFLLSPFLAKTAILQGELYAGKLLNIFARSITELAKEG